MRYSIVFLLSLLAVFAFYCPSAAQPPEEEEEEEFQPPKPVPGTEMVPSEYGTMFPKEIYWPKDGSVMVLIPHGTYLRGVPEGEGPVNESPQKEISIPSFYIDKYEVSNERYNEFLIESSAAPPRPTSSDKLLERERPVVAIPWNAARKYAQWAGKTLPTESMWEKAARGPKNTLYTTGNEEPSEDVVIAGLGAQGLPVPVEANTGDVSGYGVHHMGGNVSEWVADWYRRKAYEESGTMNPRGPETGDTRVVRGGNYFNPMEDARATYRTAHAPVYTRDEVGFRTAWVPEPPPPPEERPTPTPSPTPMPSREEIVQQMMNEIRPYLDQEAPKLPREAMAGKVYTSKGWNNLQFVNFTPYDMSLTFVGPNEGLVYKYNEPLPRMSFRNISLPRERDLCVIAYAPESPRSDPINLACLRAESMATLVLNTEMFSPLVTADGKQIDMMEDPKPEIRYENFSPQWNEIEIQNPMDEPIVVSVDDVTVSKDEPLSLSEFTLDPNQILRMTLRPGSYQFRADYVGAMEESSEPLEVTLDDRVARRLIEILQDQDNPEKVTVITKERPMLELDLVTARSIALSQQVTNKPQ